MKANENGESAGHALVFESGEMREGDVEMEIRSGVHCSGIELSFPFVFSVCRFIGFVFKF
ncbi:hypothetical protein HanIR_Chr14g0723581 [Helianthus annuus]|nr:hypothetical protein HanIR_Chr14g0723581 [Helianthus annuus]